MMTPLNARAAQRAIPCRVACPQDSGAWTGRCRPSEPTMPVLAAVKASHDVDRFTVEMLSMASKLAIFPLSLLAYWLIDARACSSSAVRRRAYGLGAAVRAFDAPDTAPGSVMAVAVVAARPPRLDTWNALSARLPVERERISAISLIILPKLVGTAAGGIFAQCGWMPSARALRTAARARPASGRSGRRESSVLEQCRATVGGGVDLLGTQQLRQLAPQLTVEALEKPGDAVALRLAQSLAELTPQHCP